MTAISFTPLRADEGMWLPSLISQRIDDMQAKGFRLGADDIYSINQASLKDAVVLFGRGCTGELVSSQGLLLTNHHCGYGQIQKHSSVEHDYLKDGFWAMNRNEELPNPGLTVRFLDRMEDVTSMILEGYEEGMDESRRIEIVRNNSKKVIDQATKAGNGLRATVEALYYGNQYFLFVYREYSDVRLVGAPPSSIGKFGGDTDNWMWPRHTGDFSIFRIYADKDNNPAEYSADISAAAVGTDIGVAGLFVGSCDALVAAAFLFTLCPSVLIGDATLEYHFLVQRIVIFFIGNQPLFLHNPEGIDLTNTVALLSGHFPSSGFITRIPLKSGAEGIENRRVIGNADQTCAFGSCQHLKLLTEVFRRGALDAIAAPAHIDGVQIELQNGVLVIMLLHLLGPEDLHDLTLNRHRIFTGDIFQQLLRNR